MQGKNWRDRSPGTSRSETPSNPKGDSRTETSHLLLPNPSPKLVSWTIIIQAILRGRQARKRVAVMREKLGLGESISESKRKAMRSLSQPGKYQYSKKKGASGRTSSTIDSIVEEDEGGGKNIQVMVRVRPLIGSEKGQSLAFRKIENTLYELDEISGEVKKDNFFSFQGIYDDAYSNEDVFNDLASKIIRQCLIGYNGTLFAYGQTASGKTYTMMGNDKDPGFMVLAADEIFEGSCL
jgi:hypothetical protein